MQSLSRLNPVSQVDFFFLPRLKTKMRLTGRKTTSHRVVMVTAASGRRRSAPTCSWRGLNLWRLEDEFQQHPVYICLTLLFSFFLFFCTLLWNLTTSAYFNHSRMRDEMKDGSYDFCFQSFWYFWKYSVSFVVLLSWDSPQRNTSRRLHFLQTRSLWKLLQ